MRASDVAAAIAAAAGKKPVVVELVPVPGRRNFSLQHARPEHVAAMTEGGHVASPAPDKWFAGGHRTELVEENEDIEVRGVLPVHAAAFAGNVAGIADLWSRSGADAFVNADDARSVAEFAARGGSVDVLRFLHEHGVPVDAPNSRNATPVIIAGQENHVDAVKYLLATCGANTATLPGWERNLMFFAVSFYSNLDLARWLHAEYGLVPPPRLAAECLYRALRRHFAAPTRTNTDMVLFCVQKLGIMLPRGPEDVDNADMKEELVVAPAHVVMFMSADEAATLELLDAMMATGAVRIDELRRGAHGRLGCNAALSSALSMGRLRVLRRLLELGLTWSGGDVPARASPLLLASLDGSLPALKFVLDGGLGDIRAVLDTPSGINHNPPLGIVIENGFGRGISHVDLARAVMVPASRSELSPKAVRAAYEFQLHAEAALLRRGARLAPFELVGGRRVFLKVPWECVSLPTVLALVDHGASLDAARSWPHTPPYAQALATLHLDRMRHLESLGAAAMPSDGSALRLVHGLVCCVAFRPQRDTTPRDLLGAALRHARSTSTALGRWLATPGLATVDSAWSTSGLLRLAQAWIARTVVGFAQRAGWLSNASRWDAFAML
jgi:hypothetical protein